MTKKEFELELMDWKEVEKASLIQLRQGKIMQELATNALDLVMEQIHKLGGLTDREENEQHKATTTTNSTKV